MMKAHHSSLILQRLALFFLSSVLICTDALSHVVTGANGYLGREIVHSLIQEATTSPDDTILCLVRPNRVESEESYWKKITMQFSSSDDAVVRVMPYDMLDGGITLEAALKTCASGCVVYHVASIFGPTENPIEAAESNVRGTLDVVRTMASFQNCALVLTSSMAAVRGTGQSPQNGKYYTHLDWNTCSQLDKQNWGSSYQWSKAQSEQQARDLCKSLGVPMASLCPSFIFGPSSQNCNSYSVQLVGQWVRGESPVQSRLCVDVRDVAKAHVVVAEGRRFGERWIVSRDARLPSQEMAQALIAGCSSAAPEKISFDAEFTGGAIPIGEQEVDAEGRLKELGITLRPVEETMADMARMLSKMSV